MIRQPAQAAALRFELDPSTHASLDETLREAAAGQVGNLPLLEFAHEELYARRTDDGCLTHAAYAEIHREHGDTEKISVSLCLPGALLRASQAVLTLTTAC